MWMKGLAKTELLLSKTERSAEREGARGRTLALASLVATESEPERASLFVYDGIFYFIFYFLCFLLCC